MYPTVPETNGSFDPQISTESFSNQRPIPIEILLFVIRDIIFHTLSYITIWRVFVLLLFLGNIKNIPLIWHLRIANAFRFCCQTQRPKVPVTSEHIFQPLITTSQAPLMETDFNLHKTNSSYFSDVDIARTHLVCTLFSTGIEYMRGGTGAYTGSGRPLFGLALGAVSCSFKKELKPYETYEMWTRVLTWDEKWIYIVTHFVRKGAVIPSNYTLYPQQGSEVSLDGKRRGSASSVDSIGAHEAVVATALSKCVFKQGRKTVAPAMMLKQSGLLPVSKLDEALASKMDGLPKRPVISSCTSSDSGIEMDDTPEETECDRVERERQRGMRVAMTLAAQAQNNLEMEFTGESEALGRHTDGTGLTGVVSTLCQLAHLRRKQIL